jgi:hypothetical protein
VYVREDVIEPLLDHWLTEIFDAENVLNAYASMAAAHGNESDTDAARRDAARWAISDCDHRLGKYRQLLEEGADPKVVTKWIGEVQEDRLNAETVTCRSQTTGGPDG